MTTAATLDAFADALAHAASSRVPVAPLTDTTPDLTIDDAYRIQRRLIARRLDAGAKRRGHKIGLTSRPMQELLGVGQPDFGVLLDEMFTEDGGDISVSTLVQPRIEAEIGLVLGADLSGPDVTVAQALDAVAGAVASLEVVDSRVADWRITIADTVADNASSGRAVLGRTTTPLDGIDPRLIGMVLSRDDDVIDTGAGAAALGSPVAALAWLANTLARFDEHLVAGEIVLPGALHKMVPVHAGDEFRAEFTHLGDVSVRFVD